MTRRASCWRRRSPSTPKASTRIISWATSCIAKGDTVGARRALQKALQAPARPERALADEGRRKEIESLLAAMR